MRSKLIKPFISRVLFAPFIQAKLGNFKTIGRDDCPYVCGISLLGIPKWRIPRSQQRCVTTIGLVEQRSRPGIVDASIPKEGELPT